MYEIQFSTPKKQEKKQQELGINSPPCVEVRDASPLPDITERCGKIHSLIPISVSFPPVPKQSSSFFLLLVPSD